MTARLTLGVGVNTMRIKLTKSGIGFGIMVKLCSVGSLIGVGIILALMFAPFTLTKWHRDTPGFLWLVFPILLVLQSVFIGVIVAAGITIYGKFSKFEMSSLEETFQQVVPPDRR